MLQGEAERTIGFLYFLAQEWALFQKSIIGWLDCFNQNWELNLFVIWAHHKIQPQKALLRPNFQTRVNRARFLLWIEYDSRGVAICRVSKRSVVISILAALLHSVLWSPKMSQLRKLNFFYSRHIANFYDFSWSESECENFSQILVQSNSFWARFRDSSGYMQSGLCPRGGGLTRKSFLVNMEAFCNENGYKWRGAQLL